MQFTKASTKYCTFEKNLQKGHFKISHYLICQTIGKGGFATVYKALQLYTQKPVAAKVIDLEGLTPKQISHLRRQVQIHRTVHHPNIARIYEVIENDDKLYIFMELVKGHELFDYVSKYGPIRESIATQIFFQIATAVKYLHAHGIVHRDLKTENIMIDAGFNVKIVDFGLARKFDTSREQFLTTFCGSPSYLSPEIIDKKKYSGKAVDVWCLGVTLYVMMEASLPFDRENPQSTKDNIRDYNWHQCLYSSPEVTELLGMIFRPTSQRASIEQILNCSLFQKHMMSACPISRFSTSDESEEISLNSDAIRQICCWLEGDQKQVRACILQQKLGPAYTLYQLMGKSVSIRTKVIKSVTAPKPATLKANTIVLRTQRSAIRKRSITPIQNTFPKTTVMKKYAKPTMFCPKDQNFVAGDAYKTKQEIINEALNTRNKLRARKFQNRLPKASLDASNQSNQLRMVKMLPSI